jgi:hypothetical protein
MSYYDRKARVHLDGTPIFASSADSSAERAVGKLLEAAWGCSIRSFGALSPIDWYAERHGRLVGLIEIKARSHRLDRYPTVFLNVRKWLALQLGACGLGCPALYVVKFEDGVCWIEVTNVDAKEHSIGGCMRIVKSVNDVEPVIRIRVSEMRRLIAK